MPGPDSELEFSLNPDSTPGPALALKTWSFGGGFGLAFRNLS